MGEDAGGVAGGVTGGVPDVVSPPEGTTADGGAPLIDTPGFATVPCKLGSVAAASPAGSSLAQAAKSSPMQATAADPSPR
jgi:hypothetical protein